MKNLIFVLFAMGVLYACSSSDDNSITINEQNFLIFGHFFGECAGEECFETFKLTNESLFELADGDLNGQNRNFIELDDSLFEQVKDLPDFFPNQLLNQNEAVFGCPDCADQGGLLIEYSENGNETSWRIDMDKSSVPRYLHEFIDRVNEKIAIINQ